ncbi:transposase [Streptomyces sp. NPDC056192]|uniref:helix-turn-helix domain-containing protein n=1 Tax=unclassified Streptomyces TaxID=2593676 RepID=UPI0035DDD3D9
MEEGRRLQRISRTAKDPVRLRRAIVVKMSAQGQPVPDITSLLQVSGDYVRDVIHAFNERGFEALDPKWSGGRPRMISSKVREHICLIARTSPAESACATPAPNRRRISPPTHPSARGPSTRSRRRDQPLKASGAVHRKAAEQRRTGPYSAVWPTKRGAGAGRRGHRRSSTCDHGAFVEGPGRGAPPCDARGNAL